MYHLRFFKLIFAIFINSNCIGQSVLIDINFARDGVNKIYAILESRGSQLPLYKLSDKINVKLPVLNVEIQEIAYTILNSKSLENFFIKGSTRLIVLNFKSENPIILAEDSIPFDFSKSTPLYFKNEELIIDLQSTVSENRIRYCISMSSFPQNIQNNEKLEMSDSIKSRNFFIRNQNIKVGDFTCSDTNFAIAICDFNNNGIYNEQLIDYIAVGIKGESNFFIAKTISSQKIKNVNYIKSDNSYFKVSTISSNGNGISLVPMVSQPSEYIKKYDKLPSNSYIDNNNIEKKLSDLLIKGKYLYIDIWMEYCPPCLKEISILEELSKIYKDRLTILTLFDKGDINDLKRINENYDITHPQGLSSIILNAELLVFGYPTGILFDERGNLISHHLSSEKLKLFLEQKQ